MPHYDYRCTECQRTSRYFYSYVDYETAQPLCKTCGSGKMSRCIGRIALAKSDATRAETLIDDSSMATLQSEDPRALGKLIRDMSSQTGESLDDQMGDVVERLERGQSAEQIEKSLPNP